MQVIIVLLLIAVIVLVLYIILLRIDNVELFNKMKITQHTVDVKYITLSDVVTDGKLIKPYTEPAFLWYILANASFDPTVEERQRGLFTCGNGYFISYSDLKILMDILEKEDINPVELL